MKHLPSVATALLLLAPSALVSSCSESASDDGGSGDATSGGETPDALPVDDDSSTTDVNEDDLDVAPEPVTRFRFELLELTDVPPMWGAITAGPLLVGGVDGLQKVREGVFSAKFSPGGASARPVGVLDMPRYCACAIADMGRNTLLVIGGRDAAFVDAPSASLVDLTAGTSKPVDDAGAADYPVGCSAFFSPPKDLGYVYGGLSGAKQAFSATTHRWDPVAGTLTALEVAGPPGRYDASVRVMNDGDALLVSGMGLASGVVFYQDLWRFDVDTETWSEIVPVSTERPPGRRYGWSALSPDESLLVFGYGSDAPNGSSVLGDMWAFTFATGQWAPLELDGELPAPRGFMPNWQIGGDDAGILAFGSEENLNVYDDAYILKVPDDLRGAWH
jgi:hypothetical protein